MRRRIDGPAKHGCSHGVCAGQTQGQPEGGQGQSRDISLVAYFAPVQPHQVLSLSDMKTSWVDLVVKACICMEGMDESRSEHVMSPKLDLDTAMIA